MSSLISLSTSNLVIASPPSHAWHAVHPRAVHYILCSDSPFRDLIKGHRENQRQIRLWEGSYPFKKLCYVAHAGVTQSLHENGNLSFKDFLDFFARKQKRIPKIESLQRNKNSYGGFIWAPSDNCFSCCPPEGYGLSFWVNWATLRNNC